MSLTFKLASLVIRTAAKPIGNYIKRQAKEHEGFRLFAIAQAQRVHRVDMRMRLGILHDSAAQDRMVERERKREEDKKRQAETPTVMTEPQQQKADREAEREKIEGGKSKKDDKAPAIKIRPLSDAKAIELGANFFSETFIFMVAAGLLVWDSWRTRSKAKDKRDELAERLDVVEAEVDRLRNKYEPGWEALGDQDDRIEAKAWWNPAGWWTRTQQVPNEDQASPPASASQSGTLDAVKQKVAEKKAAMSGAMQEPKDVATQKGEQPALPASGQKAPDPQEPPGRKVETTASTKIR